MMATVIITRHQAIARAIEEALAHIPLETLVRGKLVAVKPNETWASPEDTTGVTQPDTLRAVLQAVKRFGPRELVVTGGAGAAETHEVFRYSGMMEVVEQEGSWPLLSPVPRPHSRPSRMVGSNGGECHASSGSTGWTS